MSSLDHAKLNLTVEVESFPVYIFQYNPRTCTTLTSEELNIQLYRLTHKHKRLYSKYAILLQPFSLSVIACRLSFAIANNVLLSEIYVS